MPASRSQSFEPAPQCFTPRLFWWAWTSATPPPCQSSHLAAIARITSPSPPDTRRAAPHSCRRARLSLHHLAQVAYRHDFVTATATLPATHNAANARGTGACQTDGHRYYQHTEQPSRQCHSSRGPPRCHLGAPQLRQRVPGLGRLGSSAWTHRLPDQGRGRCRHNQGRVGDAANALQPQRAQCTRYVASSALNCIADTCHSQKLRTKSPCGWQMSSPRSVSPDPLTCTC